MQGVNPSNVGDRSPEPLGHRPEWREAIAVDVALTKTEIVREIMSS